jgi:hypothetical protein
LKEFIKFVIYSIQMAGLKFKRTNLLLKGTASLKIYNISK